MFMAATEFELRTPVGRKRRSNLEGRARSPLTGTLSRIRRILEADRDLVMHDIHRHPVKDQRR